MESVAYKCRNCGSEREIRKGDKVPVCCGDEMELKEVCTDAPHAEMARNYHEDQPCDDGRAGKRV